jgi:hypothetical protein
VGVLVVGVVVGVLVVVVVRVLVVGVVVGVLVVVEPALAKDGTMGRISTAGATNAAF